MAHAKRVRAAISAVGLVTLMGASGPAQAAPRQPAIRVTLPAATPAAPSPTPSARPTARPTEPKAAGPTAVVALPLDLKDPYTAYTLGLVPFASSIAARYVGTRRLSWQIDEELAGAAASQSLMDWGLLVGGAAILGMTTGMPSSLQGQGAFLGAAAITAIPVSHWLLYAPYWGEQAVTINRRAMVRHGFPLDEQSAPMILAPAN